MTTTHSTSRTLPDGVAASRLRRWMRIVGGFYLLLGAFNTPPVIAARFSAQYPDLAVAPTSAPAQAIVDVWFMFGLEVAVIGVALLWCSHHPLQDTAVIWTVLGLEAVRGVGHDLYLIARGYDPVFYGGFIAVHLAILVSGAVLTRRAQQQAVAP